MPKTVSSSATATASSPPPSTHRDETAVLDNGDILADVMRSGGLRFFCRALGLTHRIHPGLSRGRRRSTRSSTSLVEDGRPISRTSPSTCQKIKYNNRSDTRGSCPTSDHRWSATQHEFWHPHARLRRSPDTGPGRAGPRVHGPADRFAASAARLRAQQHSSTSNASNCGATRDLPPPYDSPASVISGRGAWRRAGPS